MNQAAFRLVRRPAFFLCFGVLVLAATTLNSVVGAMNMHLHKLPIHADRTFAALPTETRHWIRVGTDHIEGAEVVKALGTKNYLTRRYARKGPDGAPNPEGPVVEFHAAYYTGTIDPVPHIPERCLVGGGWQIGDMLGNIQVPLDTSSWTDARDIPAVFAGEVKSVPFDRRFTDSGRTRISLPVGADHPLLRTTSFVAPGSDTRIFAGYFFVANHELATSAEEVRARSFNLTAKHAYYVKLQFMSTSVETGEELAAVAGELLDDLWPEIALCLPDWYGMDPDAEPANAAPAQ